MAKNEVLYGYALLDDSWHTVSIDDIDRPFTRMHKFYCPHCHNEMYATFGEIRLPHFRHNGDKCQYSKYLHDLAEHVFYEEYSTCLDNGWPFLLELRVPAPCNKACVLKGHVDCKERYIQKTVDLTKEYTLISLEPKVDIDDRFRRPDILLESLDGKQLWVEIWVSHETEEDKRKDGRIIEIKIDTEKDLEKIRQHKIVQSEGEDLAVRIFGIEADGSDDLFVEEDAISGIKYPCENYYCFEVGSGGEKGEIIDYIKTTISTDLSYRVILRLNWNGTHKGIDGNTGKQATENDLKAVCLQRFYSYGKERQLYQDKSYDSLIVSEWKSPSFNQTPFHARTPYHRSCHRPQYQPTTQPTPSPVDISDMEWIDMGLQSGILWAKNDVGDKKSFMEAKRSYGSFVPSKENAEELSRCCTKKWDDSTHSLVFTGPNGNTLSFPCKESNKSYWLNAYEHGDLKFGQCFHIGPNGHFWINDKDSSSAIYVRLVKQDSVLPRNGELW